jgi:hypothetical protein
MPNAEVERWLRKVAPKTGWAYQGTFLGKPLASASYNTITKVFSFQTHAIGWFTWAHVVPLTLEGYARVSTDGQSVAAQLVQLTQAGADKVFKEKVSGAITHRQQLKRVLDALKRRRAAGDAA